MCVGPDYISVNLLSQRGFRQPPHGGQVGPHLPSMLNKGPGGTLRKADKVP